MQPAAATLQPGCSSNYVDAWYGSALLLKCPQRSSFIWRRTVPQVHAMSRDAMMEKKRKGDVYSTWQVYHLQPLEALCA
jgi:hypothetical protein